MSSTRISDFLESYIAKNGIESCYDYEESRKLLKTVSKFLDQNPNEKKVGDFEILDKIILKNAFEQESKCSYFELKFRDVGVDYRTFGYHFKLVRQNPKRRANYIKFFSERFINPGAPLNATQLLSTSPKNKYVLTMLMSYITRFPEIETKAFLKGKLIHWIVKLCIQNLNDLASQIQEYLKQKAMRLSPNVSTLVIPDVFEEFLKPILVLLDSMKTRPLTLTYLLYDNETFKAGEAIWSMNTLFFFPVWKHFRDDNYDNLCTLHQMILFIGNILQKEASDHYKQVFGKHLFKIMCPCHSEETKEVTYTLVYKQTQGEIEEYFKYLQHEMINSSLSSDDVYVLFMALFKNCQHNPENAKYIEAETIDFLQPFSRRSRSFKIYLCNHFQSLALAFLNLLMEHSQFAATMLAERIPAMIFYDNGTLIWYLNCVKMAVRLANGVKNEKSLIPLYIKDEATLPPYFQPTFASYGAKIYFAMYMHLVRYQKKAKNYSMWQVAGLFDDLLGISVTDETRLQPYVEKIINNRNNFNGTDRQQDKAVFTLVAEAVIEHKINKFWKKKVVAPVYSENYSYYVLNYKKINPKQP